MKKIVLSLALLASLTISASDTGNTPPLEGRKEKASLFSKQNAATAAATLLGGAIGYQSMRFSDTINNQHAKVAGGVLGSYAGYKAIQKYRARKQK